ncbi:MAG: TetR/AcrR family transcriptional regulator, partial [Acidobacteriota bacterium]|nr:TetR/AcrR family transcriptional regulator [Acidobacteriota bacterium]
AVDLLWSRSYHATGVDELCARADARKGSFYHFFPSKTDLAIAAVEARWAATRADTFEVIAQSGPPGLDRLQRLSHALAEHQARGSQANHAVLGSPFGGLGQETAHQDERLRRSLETVFDEQCRFIETWLDQAVAAGEIGVGDNGQRARCILALLEGALLLSKIADEVDVFRAIAASAPRLAGG